MTISGINYIAVAFAATNAFIWMVSYYLVMFWRVRGAAGWSEGEVQGRTSLVTYVVTFVALLIMACVLAEILNLIGTHDLSGRAGAFVGFLIWLGFVVPIIAINNVIGGRKYRLSVIDGINWLVVLVIQGSFIGVMTV